MSENPNGKNEKLKSERKSWLQAEDLAPLKPFLSVFLIISSLFIIVLAKMEERRLGYVVLKQTREQRVAIEDKRALVLSLAKVTRPQHVEKVAQDKFTLKKLQSRQIIHITGGSQGSASNKEAN